MAWHQTKETNPLFEPMMACSIGAYMCHSSSVSSIIHPGIILALQYTFREIGMGWGHTTDFPNSSVFYNYLNYEKHYFLVSTQFICIFYHNSILRWVRYLKYIPRTYLFCRVNTMVAQLLALPGYQESWGLSQYKDVVLPVEGSPC